MLETGADDGLELELARDIDGRPADALHILRRHERSAGASLEDHLWRLLPDRHPARPRVGAFRDANNTPQHSCPLALSQLLVAHYLLNAAVDAHAT